MNEPGASSPPARCWNGRNMLTVTSVAILVGTEIIGAALALGWALGGILELSETLRWAVLATTLAIGGWALVAFVRHALKVEPVRS